MNDFERDEHEKSTNTSDFTREELIVIAMIIVTMLAAFIDLLSKI